MICCCCSQKDIFVSIFHFSEAAPLIKNGTVFHLEFSSSINDFQCWTCLKPSSLTPPNIFWVNVQRAQIIFRHYCEKSCKACKRREKHASYCKENKCTQHKRIKIAQKCIFFKQQTFDYSFHYFSWYVTPCGYCASVNQLLNMLQAANPPLDIFYFKLCHLNSFSIFKSVKLTLPASDGASKCKGLCLWAKPVEKIFF